MSKLQGLFGSIAMNRDKSLLLSILFVTTVQVLAWEHSEDLQPDLELLPNFQAQLQAALTAFFEYLSPQQHADLEDGVNEVHVEHNRTEDGQLVFNIQIIPKQDHAVE